MSTRRGQSMPPVAYEKPPNKRSKCTSALCFSWKVLTCIVSHVTLIATVVSYCILGAFTFSRLEADHEKEVKRGIDSIRGNVTNELWVNITQLPVLEEDNWTAIVVARLKVFETDILTQMKTGGWDGNDDPDQIQWTFSGALFYSIIVITTIGYGHIAPKTHWGKVTTIFYAILGIPLMLLCLSNIGDIMASSFRFLYWRVCCYVCTREPKRPNRRLRRQGTARQSGRQLARSQPPMRRSIRVSQKSADSGVGEYYESGMMHAHSDTELRQIDRMDYMYQNDGLYGNRSRNRERFRDRNRDNKGRARDRHTVERDRYINNGGGSRLYGDHLDLPAPKRSNSQRLNRSSSSPREYREFNDQHDHRRSQFPNDRPSNRYHESPPTQTRRGAHRSQAIRAQSLDPRGRRDAVLDGVGNGDDMICKTPVLCNKYAIDELDRQSGRRPNLRSQSMPRQRGNGGGDRVAASGGGDRMHADKMDRLPHHMGRMDRDESPPPSQRIHGQRRDHLYSTEDMYEMQPVRRGRRRDRSVPPMPSPRIMSPMGFAVNRQARLQAFADDDSLYDDEWDSMNDIQPRIRPVPIWLCVFLVVSYIIAGAFLFSRWENWSFLDSAYFCFITLTTIGFGDFVPAQGVKEDSEISIALCSLYLLFGIALLAMSFNLVQEEVISNVKSVARRLGILKEEEIDE